MATLFPTVTGPPALGPPGGSPFGPASVQFGFEVPTGSPGELEALASGMRTAGEWFGEQLARVRASGQIAVEATGGWAGQAASSFSELAGHLAQTLSDNQLACEQAASTLGRLSRELAHAQQVTRQALADCEQLHYQMVTQQGAANDAATRASTLEQQASNPLQHPAAIDQLQHQASLARGEQTTAQQAANSAETDLQQAEKRGHDAYVQYQTDAQALTARIQAAAGDLRPVDAIAGRAAVSLVGAPGGASGGFGLSAAAIGNPFTTSPFDPYQPGSLLSAVEESRYRKYVLDAVDPTAAGGAAYAVQRARLIRLQLDANADRIVTLDGRIAEYSPNTEESAVLGAIRSAASDETASLVQAARTWGSRASFLEARLAPTLLGVSFLANVAEGKNLTQATTGTAFSFVLAWQTSEATTLACPIKTPVSEAVCATAGALAGGFGGQAVADRLTSAENAVNRQLRKAWKDVSTPIGGGGLLSGVTPLMGVNP